MSKKHMTPKRSPEKSSCSFGVCPNYLDPPPLLPLIWTTCTTFIDRQCAKIPIPQLTQYIQFVKSGPKIWAGPSPPLIWTKSKRTATFIGRLSLSLWMV